MVCFRCGYKTHKKVFNQVLIDECERCGGVWLDRGESSKIVQKKRSSYIKNFWLDMKMEEHIEKRFPIKEGGCPKCGEKIIEYKKDGLTLDRCTKCYGLFFDKDEFEELIYRGTFVGSIKRKIVIVIKKIKNAIKKTINKKI